MKKNGSLLLLTFLILTMLVSHPLAAVEWNILRTLNLERPPLDVAVSYDGQRIFILTDEGKILIYSPEGILVDKITVGKEIDQIQLSRLEDVLFLSSRENKTIQVVLLDFIQQINVFGSPFKGPVDAPVVIAIFSDFQ